MHPRAAQWFTERTSAASDWPPATIVAAKERTGDSVSIVIPARDEAATIADVVRRIIQDLVVGVGIVDELVVIDSLSTDRTAEVARLAGADVHSVTQIRPDLGVFPGKGEALWKSLFVTRGSLLVFIDADLTEWDTHFVTGLLGPLLAEQEIQLCRGFYDRVNSIGGSRTTEGGRVTELMARPLIASRWPELSAVVQPLAGEWAVRRSWFEQLPIPMGYGVEFATLVDTFSLGSIDAIAQVDLGSRAHRHQHVHDLSAMALEILSVAERRSCFRDDPPHSITTISHFNRNGEGSWQTRGVNVAERPPASSLSAR